MPGGIPGIPGGGIPGGPGGRIPGGRPPGARGNGIRPDARGDPAPWRGGRVGGRGGAGGQRLAFEGPSNSGRWVGSEEVFRRLALSAAAIPAGVYPNPGGIN